MTSEQLSLTKSVPRLKINSMAQTVTLDIKTIERIFTEFARLHKDMAELKEKLLDKEPPYGSDEWWEWSDRKAREDIKEGRYKTFSNAEDLIADLHKSLK